MKKKRIDPYRVLGLDKGADIDRIKRRYRAIALRFHPDRGPGEKEARKIFELATDAYKDLIKQKREKKDDNNFFDMRNNISSIEKEGKVFKSRESKRMEKGYYTKKSMIDLEYNSFVVDIRNNFQVFLRYVRRVRKKQK